VETVRRIGLPFGVVINRVGVGDGRMVDYCSGEGIEILAQIPERRQFAEAYSAGTLICEISPEFRTLMRDLADRLIQTGREAVS
jgi:MinD superfamily P-loop ATPase